MINILEKISHPALSNFERDFMREVLITERKRVTILAILLTGVLSSALVLGWLFGSQLEVGRQYQIWFFLLLALAIGYELLARYVFGYFIKIDRTPPFITRYGNALFETSLPTLLVGILATFVSPLQALTNPASFTYLFFIVLATLHLDFKLCFFTGAVAAIEYLGLVLYNFDQLEPFSATTMSTSLPAQLIKSLIFLLAGIIAGLVSSEIRKRFINALRSLQERNEIIHVFGQHVSPAVVNRLLDQKNGVDSEMRYVCVMFLDIRNFTSFSEDKSPTEVVNYLNTLFEAMIDSINRHHGIINKFLGDGFMAVFGAPLSDGQDCQNAVTSSLEMIEQVEKLCATGQIAPTRIGIGLHAGEAITGNVGSALRKEYTIIGDTVNLASRIEQLNKQFSSQLLISEEVWERIGQHSPGEVVPLEPVQVKGRQAAVQLYKLA